MIIVNPKVEGCPKYGKVSKKTCLFSQNVYFKCTRSFHRDSLNLKLGRAFNQALKVKGRIFTLSSEKTKVVNNLIQTICFLNQEHLVMLYDLRSTHSFISYDCVHHPKLFVKPLPILLNVSTPF